MTKGASWKFHPQRIPNPPTKRNVNSIILADLSAPSGRWVSLPRTATERRVEVACRETAHTAFSHEIKELKPKTMLNSVGWQQAMCVFEYQTSRSDLTRLYLQFPRIPLRGSNRTCLIHHSQDKTPQPDTQNVINEPSVSQFENLTNASSFRVFLKRNCCGV